MIWLRAFAISSRQAGLQLKSRSTLGYQQNVYKERLFNLKPYVIRPLIVLSTHHRWYTCVAQN